MGRRRRETPHDYKLAGIVTVTKADGTTELRTPYTPRQLARVRAGRKYRGPNRRRR